MAIQSINGTFKPIIHHHLMGDSRERDSTTYNGKTTYTRDCRFRKEDPADLIKWCRRNFGERGVGWDFTYVSDFVTIDIWYDKYKTMYEMWKV